MSKPDHAAPSLRKVLSASRSLTPPWRDANPRSVIKLLISEICPVCIPANNPLHASSGEEFRAAATGAVVVTEGGCSDVAEREHPHKMPAAKITRTEVVHMWFNEVSS